MDRLMNYINSLTPKTGIFLEYATLSDYFQAIHSKHVRACLKPLKLPALCLRYVTLGTEVVIWCLVDTRLPQLSVCSAQCWEPTRGTGAEMVPAPSA